jgi:hypothetical protein
MAKMKDLGHGQEDLSFSLCFFVPYDAVRSPVLNHSKNLRDRTAKAHYECEATI